VEASAGRDLFMSAKVLERCVEAAKLPEITTIDITGGAPELHPDLLSLLGKLSALQKRVIVRSNGAILADKKFAHFADVYAANGIEVAVSLPAYTAEKVEKQRGRGVFSLIIQGLLSLNKKGFGDPESGHILDLVHNPGGAYLPGAQQSLEKEYREKLYKDFGVKFNKLFTITNMPVGRYLEYLVNSENYEEYMEELVKAYNPSAADNVMCRDMVSVGLDGALFDCDFNQMLEMKLNHGAPDNISNFSAGSLINRRILTANHCYGCTAGSGSSCQGTVV
jgi:radical SAM/Cys-rich protein